MHDTLAGMPEPRRTTSSVAVAPEVARFAPAGLTEFAQPLPAAPTLPQGHAVVCDVSMPSPTQNGAMLAVQTEVHVQLSTSRISRAVPAPDVKPTKADVPPIRFSPPTGVPLVIHVPPVEK